MNMGAFSEEKNYLEKFGCAMAKNWISEAATSNDMAPAMQLTCKLPLCKMEEGDEDGGQYTTLAHLTMVNHRLICSGIWSYMELQ